MSRLRAPTLASLALVAGLAGCLPSPAALTAARDLDPLATPPGDLAIGVGVPETLRLGDGDAMLTLGLRGDGPEAPVLVRETVPLRLRPASGAPPRSDPKEVVYIGSIGPEDAARIAAAQARIRTLRADGVAGEGALSIAVSGGCALGAVPEALPISIWLRAGPDADFVPLMRRIEAASAFGAEAARTLLDGIEPCPS